MPVKKWVPKTVLQAPPNKGGSKEADTVLEVGGQGEKVPDN